MYGWVELVQENPAFLEGKDPIKQFRILVGIPHNTSQDNLISNVRGNVTFPICHSGNCQVFNRLKYSIIIAKYPAIFRFRQQIWTIKFDILHMKWLYQSNYSMPNFFAFFNFFMMHTAFCKQMARLGWILYFKSQH